VPFKNYILLVAIAGGYLAVVKCTLQRGASTAIAVVVSRVLSVIGDRANYHYRRAPLQGSSKEVSVEERLEGLVAICSGGCLPPANKNKEAVEKTHLGTFTPVHTGEDRTQYLLYSRWSISRNNNMVSSGGRGGG